jgi:rhamnosyltransferase
MSKPEISIIILTKNAGDIFSEVLFNLVSCEDIDKAEIIVVDSGSTDLTKEHAQKYRQIRLIEINPSDFGHGKTRNLGAKLASTDILVYLVQDATPATADFLNRLVAPLADGRVAAVYGRQLPRASAGPVERFFLQNTYPDLPQTKVYDPSHRLSIHSIFFSNVCSAIRRQVWENIPFNEHLIMSEDQQWSKEVLRQGYAIVYEPAVTVLHSHNYGLMKVFQRNFDSGCSLRGVVKDSLAHMIHYELNFLQAGIRQLALSGSSSYIPYLFLHEAARALGFALGQQAHLLPVGLNHRLSLHKYFWRTY